MNKKVYMLLSVAMLVAALAVPLSAQTVTLTANIPFAFTIGNKTLPAGEYSIRNDGNPYVVMFQGEEHHTGALSMVSHESVVTTDHPAAATKLVFNRYGDRYFLSKVVNGYAATGFVLPMPKAEKELAKTASANRFEVLAAMAKR
jgi:hypothetical protein